MHADLYYFNSTFWKCSAQSKDLQCFDYLWMGFIHIHTESGMKPLFDIGHLNGNLLVVFFAFIKVTFFVCCFIVCVRSGFLLLEYSRYKGHCPHGLSSMLLFYEDFVISKLSPTNLPYTTMMTFLVIKSLRNEV